MINNEYKILEVKDDYEVPNSGFPAIKRRLYKVETRLGVLFLFGLNRMEMKKEVLEETIARAIKEREDHERTSQAN